MAEFLTRHSIASNIEEIIKGAKNEIVLISPYLKISPNLFEVLQDADKQGKRITLVYGKDEKLEDGEMKKLQSLRNLSVRYHPALHAKCYYNEVNMVITSMNMHEYSENNNLEMGVAISAHGDEQLFGRALEEARSIIRRSRPKNFRTGILEDISAAIEQVLGSSDASTAGYCIRCRQKIPLNPERPYCDRCYREWANFKNGDFPEHFCHVCGERKRTSMDKPQCRSCYSRSD